MKTFDIVVDTQNDFMLPNGKLYVPNAEKIIEDYRNYLLNLDPSNSVGVLFLFDTHNENYKDTDEAKQFPEHCIRNTSGWNNVFQDIFSEIKVPVYTLEKGVFDMWFENNLSVNGPSGFSEDREAFFENLKEKVDEVVVGGVVTEVCVKDAISGLLKRGFKTRVIPEHTKGLNITIHELIQEPEFSDVVI